MRYYKNIDGDYLASIGTGTGGEEITQEEYESILSIIHNRPTPEPGNMYLLRTDLTWELTEAPAVDDDPDITADEALNIILGGEA